MLPRISGRNIVLLSILALSCFLSLPAIAQENHPIYNFYKKHISVADGNRCSMYPSCSTYAQQVFKKHGPLIGWMMSCDRLVRCGRDEANISRKVKAQGQILIYDPVSANDFWWFQSPKQKPKSSEQ